MNEKVKRFFKNPLGLGACALLGAIVMSFGATLVKTAGFSVSVTSGVADMDAYYDKTYGESTSKPFRVSTVGDVKAKLSYDLYVPKGVDKDHPAPAVALTHGYLNSKEFEDLAAIELARRGYVVLEYDQYDHGDSTWNTPSAFNFYVWSAYDAAEYLSSLDIVLHSPDGAAMVGVSGHSMGGFSSELAVAWDQLNIDMGVYTAPKITAVLAQGADFRYNDGYVKAYSGGAYANNMATYKNRTAGALTGEYDEFFFDNSGKKAGTVREKDYASDSVGYALLGLTKAGESNKWYQVDSATGLALDAEKSNLSEDYGERIIYKVKGDHPYNTWSPEASKHIVNFFNHAFEHQTAMHGVANPIVAKDGSAQIWWLKEVFTCLGMLMVMAAVLFGLLGVTALPFAKLANTDTALLPQPEKATGARKVLGVLLSAFSIVLSAFLIPALMAPTAASSATQIALLKTILDVVMYSFLGIGLIFGILGIVFHAKGDEELSKKFSRSLLGGILVSLIAFATKWLVTDGTAYVLSGTNRYFNAPSVNTIAFWAIASGLLALIFTLISHFFVNPGRDVSHLGLRASWKSVGVALVNAIVISGIICGFVWLIALIFNTDFRVYTYAIKTVNGNAFVSSLRYLPFFFVFYLCAGISVASATAGKKGVKADLLAVVIELAPVALFLIYQYGKLLATGVAPFPDAALNGILAQGLVFTLIGLAVFQRRSLQKTGNIWTGVFLNTIFFTFITCANTTIYMLK